jgi:hypothetical protein
MFKKEENMKEVKGLSVRDGRILSILRIESTEEAISLSKEIVVGSDMESLFGKLGISRDPSWGWVQPGMAIEIPVPGAPPSAPRMYRYSVVLNTGPLTRAHLKKKGVSFVKFGS